MSLDELTARQRITREEIKRIAVYYKTDTATRKTAENLNTRLINLNQLWEEFEKTDNEIRINYGSKLDHAYFANDYYEGIRVGYDKLSQDILRRLQEFSSEKLIQIDSEQERIRQVNNPGATVKPQSRSNEAFDGGAAASIEQQSMLEDNNTGALSKSIKADNSAIICQQTSLMQGLRNMLNHIKLQAQPHSAHFYQIKIKAIEHHWEKIQHFHSKILEDLDDSYLSDTMGEYFELEELTHEKLVNLYEGLSHSQPKPEANANSLAAELSPKSSMKLPKVELPKFDGDYLKWRQFCDLFSELVHNQPLPSCQKMWYLKSILIGEAEKLVQHLTITEANYATAWKLINDRYENPRLLVTALLNKILSQPTATTASASAIKTIHDTTQECLLALGNLGINIENWDPLLLHILMKKLDRATHTLWEQSLSKPRSLQSLKEFLQFLENRFQSLEAMGNTNRTEGKKVHTQRALTTSVKTGCPSCGSTHQLFACPKFLQLSPSNRTSLVKRINSCLNCLRSGHIISSCPSRGCLKCGKKHNTLLHFEPTKTKAVVSRTNQIPTSEVQPSTSISTTSSPNRVATEPSISLTAKSTPTTKNYVLLSTAIVKLTNKTGTSIECRAILDSGSQLNFVTQKLVKKLGLIGTPELMNIEGIGLRKQQAQKRVNMLLESRINGFSTTLEAHILPRIISPQPSQLIDSASWPIPANIQLADAQFNQPGTIDLLIGAELYYSILSVGQIKLGKTLPTMQNTVFGWTIAGRTQHTPQIQAICGICSEDEALQQQMEKFWMLDDAAQSAKAFTTAERQCEAHFVQTTRRNKEGRFTVKLPFKVDAQTLGESKNIAFQRFVALEKRLDTNEELKKQYVRFLDEYIELGHMEEVNFNEIKKPYNFLLHHCVIKPESSTTKLRVVFDGSAKTSSNISLNDILATGPTIQDDVFSLLLRFRMPRFVFTADIEKMYRQVKVHDDDTRYQLIWWRNNSHDRLRCYKLCTVTYGTTCAPYLASRCLQMLAEEQAEHYPLGAEVLKRDFYVDDVLTGADNLTTAIETQAQLQFLLQTAGFKLRKWCANHPSLLKSIPQQDQEVQLDFYSHKEDHTKAVGLTWLPKSDNLCIKTTWKISTRVTKRNALSDIAHLFDPLGIMAPVIVVAKIFLQKLWAMKCDWDAALPQELHSYWLNFREGLKALNDIRIPRHVFSQRSPKTIQIHIFADASEKAYGAAAYIRSIDRDNIVAVRLLCAKSRIAPIKQVTLPRLELCAAKLAAELAGRLKRDLKIKNAPLFLWTDSEIVLAWINSSSSSYQTFVANRIAVIQQLTISEQWRHVRSKDNPADISSRGIAPEKLGNSVIGFYGPTFLHGAETLWPLPYTKKTVANDSERRRVHVVASSTEIKEAETILSHINHRNSFRKVQRIMAYVLRFIRHTRKLNRDLAATFVLNAEELDQGQAMVVRLMQQEGFDEDVSHLRSFGEVSKNSAISSLTPFIDEDNIVSVGGRLEESNLTYQAKHPMLLPYAHHLTKCLLNDIHKEKLHVGPQTLLAITRQKFWPLKGKTLARSVVQHCVQCAKSKPKLLTQLMGNLPADRVQPARPFVNAGVDFCGPIYTHFKIRGKRPQKSYIAVFCCFSTKATHLEIVSDLSTQGFLGALRRFMARRGHCRTIYCDNATNFVGAKNQLEEVKYMIESSHSRSEIIEACSSKTIDFRFIPPRAPHFGGLWEAAVKSAKHLLQRTLASDSLTYEELETVVVEIEAVLNSGPITPMSSDPNDLTALTPGHFLIGEPLTSTIDPKAKSSNSNLITRWKRVSHIKNEFWRRWTMEYLSQLQHRYKWKQRCQNVQPGTMVLLKEDNIPALKWPLGRIINTIRGNDGLVRVADIRTSSGIIRRPIYRLAPLPIEAESSDEPATQNETEDKKITTTIPSSNISQPTRDEPTTSYEPTQPRRDANPRKKQRRSVGSAIVTLLLTCLMLPSINSSPIETKPFTHHPGIYFENLGAANIVANEWKLVVFYDMTAYWKEFALLQNCTRALEELCQRINEREQCLGIIAHIKQLQLELDTNNILLAEPSNSNRSKRGAINFIGNVASALFGVLDSEYAEKMAQTINDIGKNENHLLDLIKNQTSIMDATLNIMKKEEQSIDHQFQQIETQIAQTTQQLHDIREEAYQEKLSQSFMLLTLSAILTVSNFFRIQSSILDVIIDTHHGKISPLLISPLQLKQELIKIKTNLPSSLRLPIQQDEALKYYTLMTIEGRVAERYIIFKLTLPLLSLEEFELFKVTPVPVQTNDTFVTIQPSFPFLVINLHRDQYYPLTEQELQLCLIIDEGQHLCKQKHPLYRRGSNISACELNFFNHLPQSSSCQIVKTGNGPHWIQMYSPNQWIYALSEKTTINVVCDKNTTQYVIKGTGILKIRDRCLIKQPLVSIQGHSVYPTNTRSSYIPTSNLTEFIISAKKNPTLDNTVQHQSYTSEIDSIKGELSQFKKNLSLNTLSTDVHQFSVGYVSIILIIVVISILIWKHRHEICAIRSRKMAPVPTPRQRTTMADTSYSFNASFDV